MGVIPSCEITSVPSDLAFLSGGGAMGELMRQKDWSRTPLGPADQWPQSLRTALSILLQSGYPMYIAWGPDYIQFYNDAYRPILGSTKHPVALGQSSRECFDEIWHLIGPMFQRVMNEGENTTVTDLLLPLNRNNYLEECYFTFSYSAVRDESARVGGVFVTCIETTEKVLGERRLQTLRELAAQAAEARDMETACGGILRTLSANRFDLPFALLYQNDDSGKTLLSCITGIPEESPLARYPWQPGTSVEVIDIEKVFSAPVPGEVWPEPVRHAAILPLMGAGQNQPIGFLVAGISPRRAVDSSYSSFLQLTASQAAGALANARAYAEQRRRADALAELDRAKTAFFSNVSHEFRTPLTLMLGPLNEALAAADNLPESLRENLSVAKRNSLRLLKLVNTLLDFSRIEAGRVEATYSETDLSTLTADLASTFRSAVEKAGLTFVVRTPEVPCVAHVDIEMWEKIVLNLISNAFKYTREGQISVSLTCDENKIVLNVADTGIGIPAAELPRIFERFHRVEGAFGRTLEGTGIGLALVAELVKIHNGAITAESVAASGAGPGGTLFTVTIPRFSKEGTQPPAAKVTSSVRDGIFAEEASRLVRAGDVTSVPARPSASGKVLIAEDNGDIRDYLGRILCERFQVFLAPNGAQAMESILRETPDVVLTDVMMPELDGFGLLSAIRSNAALKSIPVILLSARAGEEARIEGVESGADDYLVKPFSARELLARVTTHVTLSRLRTRWRDLLLQAPALIAVLRGPDHVFELVNPPYTRFVGRTAAWLVGKRVIDALPEVSGQGFIELLDRVYTTGESFEARDMPLTLDYDGSGTLATRFVSFVYQASRNGVGIIEGILVHATDVTDTVEARKRVEESESRLRTLAESIPQLVWTCLPNGDCDYLSHQWERYTGIPAAQQLGLHWLDLVMYPEDRQRTYDAWMAAVEDRAPYDIEYRLRRHDGVYRWFKTRGTPLRDSEGRIEKWFGTCTDIEDQKQAERAMVQKQKLESIGLLAGGIAHDFNNLLVGVLGNASLIGESLPEDDPLQPLIRAVVEAGERAAHLTRQMLAYAGKGRFFVETIDLGDLVRTTYGLIRLPLPKQVDVVFELAPSLPSIEADSGQIQQVIMNLVINAAEAIPEGQRGTVRIRTGALTLDGNHLRDHRFLSAEPPAAGKYAFLEVSDTGSGMDEATLSRIFDPFFTTKFTGRGLGLAAVQGIVRSAKGALEVSSTVGQGTVFRVFFPTASPASLRPPAIYDVRRYSTRKGTVLVIDDEAMVRQTTRASLEKAGYRVVLASGGEEGVRLFSRHSDELGLIVLDMSMPGMGGKETLRQIRQLHPAVPVVISSGYSEEQAQDHFAGMNIAGFLQKPFTARVLESVVESALSAAGR